METATFGAGCFWGVEHAFREIPGVTDTMVGYEGGTVPNPTYKDVCTDRTGHAEVVQVTYDEALVSYQKLLDAFFDLHDPTQRDRQGPDFGTQYRTVVFYHSPEQQAQAQKTIADLTAAGKYRRPIVTQVVPATTFYPAEDYHQRYFEKQGIAPTCHT
ncbi:MAG TPA: peptide-methionine (S)-S-oxide reductase MsrA [Candidatus Acidoferrales bacterium]|nr:peptide-methionine (S)-S-oxide reductase MsrA [Candidatus Acidoferrales bacterium]